MRSSRASARVPAAMAPSAANAASNDDRVSHLGPALVVGVLLTLGLAWGMWLLAHARFDARSLSLAAWADGRAGVSLNHQLRMPGQSTWDTWSAALRYRMLGDLGPDVVMGCPQWLFYRDGLRPRPGVQVYEKRLDLMRHWIAQIRARGVQVLVVAVPDKSRIESDHLCGMPVSQEFRRILDRWQQALALDGVLYADLRPALQLSRQDMFFRTDVHLNAEGAAAAAHALAQVALPLLQGPGTQQFSHETATPPQPRMGDLVVLAGLEHAPAGWRPYLEEVAEQNIKPVRSGGLLDDTPPAEVLLAGSSNGRRSHFAEYLGMGLGREVWNLSQDGGQFSGALITALKQRAQGPASLKLVIWEFSENALSLPLTADERIVLSSMP